MPKIYKDKTMCPSDRRNYIQCPPVMSSFVYPNNKDVSNNKRLLQKTLAGYIWQYDIYFFKKRSHFCHLHNLCCIHALVSFAIRTIFFLRIGNGILYSEKIYFATSYVKYVLNQCISRPLYFLNSVFISFTHIIL